MLPASLMLNHEKTDSFSFSVLRPGPGVISPGPGLFSTPRRLYFSVAVFDKFPSGRLDIRMKKILSHSFFDTNVGVISPILAKKIKAGFPVVISLQTGHDFTGGKLPRIACIGVR